jgi:hypothetical protein
MDFTQNEILFTSDKFLICKDGGSKVVTVETNPPGGQLIANGVNLKGKTFSLIDVNDSKKKNFFVDVFFNFFFRYWINEFYLSIYRPQNGLCQQVILKNNFEFFLNFPKKISVFKIPFQSF